MLNELARYAQDNGLAARAGFKAKKVKGYICLGIDGSYLGIMPVSKDSPDVYAPDIGSAANGTRYCNFLIEKAKITLCVVEDEKTDRNVKTKFGFYLSMLEEGMESEPLLGTVLQFLSDDVNRERVLADLSAYKLKPADPIGFMVDGKRLEDLSGFLTWWNSFRERFSSTQDTSMMRCLVSGEQTIPLPTVPKVSGLLAVGGHTSGDAFLCFDKDAFQSFGFKQSANAAVSEDAMTAVNAALTDLLAKAPIYGNAKIVHWYTGENPVDLMDFAMEGTWFDSFSDEEPAEDTEVGEEEKAEAQREAMQAARSLFAAVKEGKRPPQFSSRYYIMPLSGAGGRMMVRGWYEGSFENLYFNLDTWFSDLRIVSTNGKGRTKPPKLKGLTVRLLKPGGDPSKQWDRINSELANLSNRLLDSIINGSPLPDEVGIKALHYIQSLVYQNDDTATGKTKSKLSNETLTFQLLKAWLNRRRRQKGDENMIGESLNDTVSTPAYACGRLMAVHGAIQEASREINVGVTERYFAAASTKPKFVIGKLEKLSVIYLAGMNKGLSNYYSKMLTEIYSGLSADQIPSMLTPEQQTEFVLGYYHQRAAMYAGKPDASDTPETEND